MNLTDVCTHASACAHTNTRTHKRTIPTNSLFPDTWKHHAVEQTGTDTMFLPGSGSTVETAKAGAVTALRGRKSPKVIRSEGI